MKCPQCDSNQTAKNGHRRERQCYKCKQYGPQFLKLFYPWAYSQQKAKFYTYGYIKDLKQEGSQ